MMKNNYYMKLLCLIFFVTIMQVTSAKIWYVGTWPSQPVEDVKATLEEAYNEAAANDEIWMAEGTYPTPNLPIKNNVAVYGGFAGTETDKSQRQKPLNAKPWEFEHPTVLINTEAQIFVNSGNNSLIVDGLTFDGKKADGQRAINADAGTTNHRISNCIVRKYKTTGNMSRNGNGAGMVFYSKATIDGCLITDNDAAGAGGGMYINFGTVVNNCKITDNKSANRGGGIGANYADAGPQIITNCLIANNESVLDGGGVFGDRINMYNCIVINNIADKDGGGIALRPRNENSQSILSNLTLAYNCSLTPGASGGIAFATTTSDTGNAACKLFVFNSILWNNNDGNKDLINLKAKPGQTANRKLQNCIVDRIDYSDITFTDNIIESDSAAIFGPNWTTKRPSSAVNAGFSPITDPAGITLPTTDFAGNPRIEGAAIDIGPYETIPVSGVTLGSAFTIEQGNTTTLAVTILPTNATNQALTWLSDDESIATIDANTGQLTGIAVGETTILVTTVDGNFEASCRLTVAASLIPVSGVTLDQTTATLSRFGSLQLTAVVAPDNATNSDIRWSSDNAAIATVDATGLVKAIAAGTTNIVVTSIEGAKKDTCIVTVQSGPATLYVGGAWGARKTHDNLSSAYSVAAAGDQIWIAAGEHTTPQLTVKNAVSVYGSFAGTETAIEERAQTPNGKPWEFVNPTVIKNSGAAVFTTNAAHTSKTVFDGLTFDGENTEFHRAMNFADVIRTNTNYVISNCVVKNYRMNGDGGGLNIRNKTEIFNCLISNNKSANGGGGIYMDADCSVHHCEITGNESAYGGGGISANGLQGGGVSVYNCLVANNTSNTGTGGINGNRAAIYNCLVLNNTGGNVGGIGLDIRYASTVYNNTIVNNRSTGDDDPATGTVKTGGLAFYNNANATRAASKVYNTILWNNRNKDNAVANLAKQNTAGNNNSSTFAANVYNSLVDRTDYTDVTCEDCITATDSATIFGENYTLKAGSPAIDAGDVFTTMPATDFCDGIRLIGNSIDIGMYEDQNGVPYVNPNIAIFDGMVEIIRNEKERSVNINQLAATVSTYVYNENGVCNVAAGGNGFFPDLDYSDTQGNSYNWKATQHLDRLINMAYAYTMQGSLKQGDNSLFSAIEAGIRAWINTHPNACTNWWYNQIAEPQRLGLLLIQMRKGTERLDKEATETPVLTRMYNRTQSGYPGTGNATSSSNITNVAEHCIYSALLSYDAGRLRTMLYDFVYPAVSISTGISADGIKPDQSHIMHSRVLYIGGYGEELIKNVTYFSVFTAGTHYAMPEEKTAILGDFVRNTWLKSVRGRYMLWDVTGRGLSRISELDKRGATIYLERMKSIDPAHIDEYDAGIKRLGGEKPANYQIEPMSRQHFIADHTLHIRPEYTFDVNFVSTRTRRIEWGNGENKKALYMSDGCTNIVRRGDEYATIQGTWNWARIPGITCLQTPSQATISDGSTTSVDGTSTFAGGVTDSLYSVTAYSYPATRVNLSAKKGWFMFDDEIVCLGNSITAASGQEAYNTNTTINQSNLNGNVVVSENGNGFIPLAATGDHVYATAPKWVLHDTIGYVFPAGGHVVVSNQEQTGNWHDINNNGVNAVVSRDIFSLWFDHGKSVTNGTYAYIIVPGKTAIEMQDYYTAGNIELLANTASVQAVHHKTLGIYGIIFYSATTFTGGDISVEVDRPCVLLLKDKTSYAELNVADPAQAQARINVKTKIPATAADWITTVCDFTNTGDYRGASKAFVVPLSYVGIKDVNVADPVISVRYYDLTGREVVEPSKKCIYIVQKTYLSGKKISTKVIL